MIRMKHLVYTHSVNRSLVETLGRLVHGMLPTLLRSPKCREGGHPIRTRVCILIGWFFVLAVQAALLVVISELVEVIHGVMNLYLDLAQQQLDLTSLYVAATNPPE